MGKAWLFYEKNKSHSFGKTCDWDICNAVTVCMDVCSSVWSQCEVYLHEPGDQNSCNIGCT